MRNLQFSKGMVDQFWSQYRRTKGLRLGQAFHTFFKLDKVQGLAKPWCDKIYQADNELALIMINEATVHE